MKTERIKFAVIGSGWRAMYYVRIAKAREEIFELCGLLCRRQEKAAAIAAAYDIPVFTDE